MNYILGPLQNLFKKFIKTILKGILNPYLLEELTVEQLSFNVENTLATGFQLSNLRINPDACQIYLPSCFHVIRGEFSITIDIYSIIWYQKLNITLTNVNFDMGIGSKSTGNIQTQKKIIEEEITKSCSESNYSMDNAHCVAYNFNKMIHEVELDIKDLTLTFPSFSKERKNVSLVLKVPKIKISHLYETEYDPIGNIMKNISLPNDFKVFLKEDNDNIITETLLLDGPEFEELNPNILPTYMKVIIANQSFVEIKVDIAIKAIRIAIAPNTLQTLLDSFDFTEFIISNNTDKNNDDITIHIGNNTNSVNLSDSTKAIDSEEFFDCEESFIYSDNNEQKETLFYIFLSIKQATITFLRTSNESSTNNIFRGFFDLNRLYVPPYSPCNHTTLYLSELTATLLQMPSRTTCDLTIPICGITQFRVKPESLLTVNIPDTIKDNFSRWWSEDDFIATNVLLFNSLQKNKEHIPPIKVSISIIDNITEIQSIIKVLLGQIKLDIDDEFYHNITPYINIFLSRMQIKSNNTPPNNNTQDIVNICTNISLTADEISLKLHSSESYVTKGIIFNLKEVNIGSTFYSKSESQEWIVDYNTIICILDKEQLKGYNNMEILFSSSKYYTLNDSLIPLRIILKKSNNTLYDNRNQNSIINIIEHYEPDIYNFSRMKDGNDIPIPIIYNNNMFEDKQKNNHIADNKILQDFYEYSSKLSSILILFQLSNISIDITKENYDITNQILSDFIQNFNKYNNQDNNEDNNENTTNNSIVCKLKILDGSFVLHENNSKDSSNFYGSFHNLTSFLVTNYDMNNSMYIYNTIEYFNIKYSSPLFSKPIQLIEKLNYIPLYNNLVSCIIKMNPLSTTIIIDIMDILIHYKLGNEWISKLQHFFISNNNENSNSTIMNMKIECNMSNIIIDYLPQFSLTSCAAIYYIKQHTEVTIIPFISSSILADLYFRGNSELYLINDINNRVNTLPKINSIEQYFILIGYKHIGKFEYLQINVKLYNNNSKPMYITIENNNTYFHLCHDSTFTILQLYNDYSGKQPLKNEEKENIDSSINNNNTNDIDINDIDIDDFNSFENMEETSATLSKYIMEDVLTLPESSPVPILEFHIIDFDVNIKLYKGNHWTKGKDNEKSKDEIMDIFVNKINISYYSFNKQEQLQYRLGLKIKDIEVINKYNILYPNILLSYNTSYKRIKHSSMINIMIQQSKTITEIPHIKLNCKILPIQININQGALFFKHFLNIPKTEKQQQEEESQLYWDEIYIDKMNIQLYLKLIPYRITFDEIIQNNISDFDMFIDKYQYKSGILIGNIIRIIRIFIPK